MGPGNLKALEEIKALGHQVELAGGLADLEPIRQGLDRLVRAHFGDAEVQKAVEEARRLLLVRATQLTLATSPPAMGGEPPTLSSSTSGAAGISDLSGSLSGELPTSPRTIQAAPTTIPDAGVILPVPPVNLDEPMKWKRALWMGMAVGIALSLILIVVLVNVARRRNVSLTQLAATDVAVQVSTNPPGASIRVNGEAKCTSDCKLTLAPGVYQITAFLDGYEPAASGVNLVLGKPETLNLNLEARPQTVRVLSDLAQGKVVFDQQPPAELQDGQYVFERIPPGTHTVSVTGPNAEASFSFELLPAKQPVVNAPVNTRNMLALLVSSFAGHARLMTNSGPWKLAVNGQPEDDAGPTGVDLKNFQGGLGEISISQSATAKDSNQRTFKEDFGPGPTLTVFLKTDRNVGTLIVSTGENNARVFLNNKEYPRRTQSGQLRIQTIGTVEVRVVKAGFENAPAQKAEVKKGSEVRLEFKMKPMAEVSALQITGATPGAEVLIDQRSMGTVADDGTFRDAGVAPGEHVIGLRRDRFSPKQFSRTFAAGQTVTISGSDAVLAAERPPAPPPPPPLPPEPRPEPVVPKPPPVRASSMDGFESQEGWMQQENGVWRHRGGGFLTYKLPSTGLYSFAVYLVRGGNLFRGGRVRWVTDYVDSRNYVVSELDENNLTIRDVVNGKSTDHAKIKHNADSKDKAWAIQIETTPDRLIQRIQKGDQWVTLDSWTKPEHNFADGKFGFWVQGSDEIGVSDFKFTPAR